MVRAGSQPEMDHIGGRGESHDSDLSSTARERSPSDPQTRSLTKLLSWSSSSRSANSVSKKRSKEELAKRGSKKIPSLELKRHQSLSKISNMLRTSARIPSQGADKPNTHKSTRPSNLVETPIDPQVLQQQGLWSDNPLFAGKAF